MTLIVIYILTSSSQGQRLQRKKTDFVTHQQSATQVVILLSSDTTQTRCTCCESHRHTLRSLACRVEKEKSVDKTAPNSHVNYRFLRTPEKADRLKRTHSKLRCFKLKNERLKSKLIRAIEEDGIDMAPEMHKDLQNMMIGTEHEAMKMYPEDSFQHVFWKQQQEATRLKNKQSMRWHPLIIKWCLYLRHVSGRAYETMRSSGCIHLPSQRTLRDYTHYVSASTGFSNEVDQQLASAANVECCTECEKYVAIIFDEMYIKEDLVYNKHTNALIGFANLGDTNTHLLAFQKSLQTPVTHSITVEELAKTMMVFMVRGLCSRLEFPYAQFPCSKVTGDLLFQPFWEAVRRLEFLGLKVIATTADGASTNRRFFRLHNLSANTMPHMVENPYGSEKRNIYFFSDVPHLLKTARNGLASNKHNLWVSVTLTCSSFKC